jgi:hypothetical protein
MPMLEKILPFAITTCQVRNSVPPAAGNLAVTEQIVRIAFQLASPFFSPAEHSKLVPQFSINQGQKLTFQTSHFPAETSLVADFSQF